MKLVWVLALVCGAWGAIREEDDAAVKRMGDTCDTVFCSLGKECVMENKKPTCACIEKCGADDNKPVCGSVGAEIRTYQSLCHLYKHACESNNTKITLVAKEPCKQKLDEEKKSSVEIEKNKLKEKPVVCMEKHRDGLRSAIIKFVSGKMGIKTDSVSYKGTLLKYFFSLDTDSDQLVDTKEFMQILDEDASITEILNHDNPVLRGLCSTELIAITDINSDYKLGWDEFYKCLDPKFEPPREKCELGGLVYEDGEDVPLACNNSCKCACGHWVCTQRACPDQNQNSNRAQDILNA